MASTRDRGFGSIPLHELPWKDLEPREFFDRGSPFCAGWAALSDGMKFGWVKEARDCFRVGVFGWDLAHLANDDRTSVRQTGWMLDVELLDDRYGCIAWHFERRFRERAECLSWAERVRRYLDARTLDQLRKEPKNPKGYSKGPLHSECRMSSVFVIRPL